MPLLTKHIKLVFVTSLFLVLTGCATLGKDECNNANWKIIGYEDGAAGHATSRIGKHRKACAKHNISPDLALYNTGHSEGVIEYCKPLNGFNVGTRGKQYKGVCPGNLESEFLAAYKKGKQLHTLKSKLSRKKNQLRNKKTELKTVKTKLAEKESLLVGKQGSATERTALLFEIKELNQQQGTAEAQIREYEIGIVTLTLKVNHFRRDY